MKKMLVVGGGYADIPLIVAAKEEGYFVITSGNRPEDIGHKYSDEYHCADFSDNDAIYRLAKTLNVDAICPSCNDFSAVSSSYAAEKLGLPGHDPYDITLLIHHKDKFRSFAEQEGIPSPKAQGFSSVEEATENLDLFEFPIIVKPVDLTGGKGVSKAYNKRDAVEAISLAFSMSRQARVVVEEFHVGSYHGFSALIENGEVVFYFDDNEYYYLNQYMVSGASSPSFVSEGVKEKIVKISQKIARSLNLTSGILHIQYVLTGDKPYIIEVCRRPPGDLYIELVKFVTGVDYPKQLILCFAGKFDSSHYMFASKQSNPVLRHCIMASKNGVLENVEFSKYVKNRIFHEQMWWNKGDEVSDFLTHKFGIVFIKCHSVEALREVSASITEHIIPIVKN